MIRLNGNGHQIERPSNPQSIRHPESTMYSFFHLEQYHIDCCYYLNRICKLNLLLVNVKYISKKPNESHQQHRYVYMYVSQ